MPAPNALRRPDRRLGPASRPFLHDLPAPGWALPPEVNARLDVVMRGAVTEVAGPLGEPLIRVIGAGGKRLRPALTMAIAAIGGRTPEDPGVLELAAAVELLHCATLVHDDLIDGGLTRRGVVTISAQEGSAAAVVGGDLLIAAASGLACGVSRKAGVIVAQTLAALCRGEAVQDQARYDASTSVDLLVEVARLKTGRLFQAACSLGAQVFDAGPDLSAAVAAYGMDLGICFQLVDDLLDVVADPALIGKPVGADFASGTLTLPIALAIREFPELGALLRADLNPVSRGRAMNLLQNADAALAATADTARAYAHEAGTHLRSAAGGQGPAEQLTGWPMTYLTSQLQTKVGEQHRWLAAQLMSGAA
jgi:geranylgeranyl pyrophosphate synthase